MAEDWGDVETGPKRKQGVPKWVWWGCGGGCLLATLVLAGVAVFMFTTVKEAMDPEVQWPKLQEVLPFDERPPLELEVGIGIVGVERFELQDPVRGLRASVQAWPSAARSQFEELMSPEGQSPLGFGRPVAPEETTVTVQGREVPALRFERLEREPEAYGPGIRLDLSGPGAPRAVDLRKLGGGPLEDADIEAFFAPFDVWRGR